MIIVSQDKKSIYNFDNIKSIDIVENEIYITDDILMDEGAKIGEYETEERAKEVLQEIIKAYIESKKGEEATTIFGFAIIPSNTYYEMPEE